MRVLCVAAVLLAVTAGVWAAGANLDLASGKLDLWTVEGANTWSIDVNPELFSNAGDPSRYVVDSYRKGEHDMGVLRGGDGESEDAGRGEDARGEVRKIRWGRRLVGLD